MDVSDALDEWLEFYRIKIVTKTSLNFVVTETVFGRDQECVVQVASRARLTPAQISTSAQFLLVHSKEPLSIDELLEFNSQDYIFVERGDWSPYGYYENIAQETNKPLVVETP